MNRNTFDSIGILEPIQRALKAENITQPTPVQKEAIPLVLEGHDVMGCAQTGSGKTAAFALPILQQLAETRTSPVRGATRALVLTPTRELAEQVASCSTSFGRNLGLRVAAVYGGVSRNEQIRNLSRGVDVTVATPGRLLDLMNDRKITLGRTEIFVLDEADRMLDMGFIPDIKKICAALPERRQTLLFSATMPPAIMGLAANLLREPRYVEVTSNRQEDPRIEQKVLFVNNDRKRSLLMQILSDREISRVLVFTRTKHKANKLARQLTAGKVKSDALHGDKTQGARQKALRSFSTGRIRVLVATDIAARGIDVDNIDHVINYDLPMEPEVYVHRIGRTARAGKQGTALSFCDASEVKYLGQIEKLLKKQLTVWQDQPFHAAEVALSCSADRRHGVGGNAKRATQHAGGGNANRQADRGNANLYADGKNTKRQADRKNAKRSSNGDWYRKRSGHNRGWKSTNQKNRAQIARASTSG